MSFVWLLFAHFIGDIALQSEWQAKNKARYWYVMLSHCMIWTAVICIALQYIGLFEYWKVVFLLVGHIIMDEWKSHQPYEKNGVSNWWMIYPDQTWHLIQLIIVFII